MTWITRYVGLRQTWVSCYSLHMAQNEPTYKGHQEHVKEEGVERQNVTYIDTPDGNLILLICPVCNIIETHCLHVRNSWDDEGKNLTCNLCGIDGT